MCAYNVRFASSSVCYLWYYAVTLGRDSNKLSAWVNPLSGRSLSNCVYLQPGFWGQHPVENQPNDYSDKMSGIACDSAIFGSFYYTLWVINRKISTAV